MLHDVELTTVPGGAGSIGSCLLGRSITQSPSRFAANTAGASQIRDDGKERYKLNACSAVLTFAMGRTFGSGAGVLVIPATLPISEIVAKLNELQPDILAGYPSML